VRHDDQDHEEPEPVASSTSDATGRDTAKHAGVPPRRVRAGEVRWEKFLYELKAGPAGGRLRRPSSAGSTTPWARDPRHSLTCQQTERRITHVPSGSYPLGGRKRTFRNKLKFRSEQSACSLLSGAAAYVLSVECQVRCRESDFDTARRCGRSVGPDEPARRATRHARPGRPRRGEDTTVRALHVAPDEERI
jgi:hypothetical protein